MYTLFRISDAGNPKPKLAYATQLYCLDNYLEIFGGEGLLVFADNCLPSTLEALRQRKVTVYETALGNSGLFLHLLDFVIENFSDDVRIYFLEDDYLHTANAPTLLQEGLDIADYVTLYDHPDKYMNAAEGGPNRFVNNGGELSRVLCTKSSHWKETNSTTRTFAATRRVLAEDRAIWRKRVYGFPVFTFLQHRTLSPWDFFRLMVSFHPRRRLISPLPGAATHCETAFLASLVQWEAVPPGKK